LDFYVYYPRNLFWQILTFSQKNLQLSLTTKFLVDYALNYFIHDKEKLDSTIFEHQVLGAHTDIISFKDGQEVCYFWAHPKLRPHGHPTPVVCPKCKRLKPWEALPPRPEPSKKKASSSKSIIQVDTPLPPPIILHCRNCKDAEMHTYEFRQNAKWVKGNGYNDTERVTHCPSLSPATLLSVANVWQGLQGLERSRSVRVLVDKILGIIYMPDIWFGKKLVNYCKLHM